MEGGGLGCAQRKGGPTSQHHGFLLEAMPFESSIFYRQAICLSLQFVRGAGQRESPSVPYRAITPQSAAAPLD